MHQEVSGQVWQAASLAALQRIADEPTLQKVPAQGVPDVIDTAAAFQAVCARYAASTGLVAADAERASGFRYDHKDWLVQLKRGAAGITLLDAPALSAQAVRWEALNEAVGDATWVLHDALQDLPGFAELGLKPAAVFDTQVAARLLGMQHFGLAAVTSAYLGKTLAKEHSAADWSMRPLPRDLRNYAALDVELLIELAERMREDLRRAGKLAWAKEEFEHVLRQGMQPLAPHPIPWLRISHINEIIQDRQGLAIARALWLRRDELAREHDIAPTLLLPDAAIIEAAKRKPHNMRAFRAIRSLQERVRMHTGGEQDKMFERYAPIQRAIRPSIWKAAIEQALALPSQAWSNTGMDAAQDERQLGNAPRSMRLWRQHQPQRYAKLLAAKAVIERVSQEVGVAPDVLIKPQIIRNLCWHDDDDAIDVIDFLHAQGARNWQIELVGASLARAIM